MSISDPTGALEAITEDMEAVSEATLPVMVAIATKEVTSGTGD